MTLTDRSGPRKRQGLRSLRSGDILAGPQQMSERRRLTRKKSLRSAAWLTFPAQKDEPYSSDHTQLRPCSPTLYRPKANLRAQDRLAQASVLTIPVFGKPEQKLPVMPAVGQLVDASRHPVAIGSRTNQSLGYCRSCNKAQKKGPKVSHAPVLELPNDLIRCWSNSYSGPTTIYRCG